MFFENQTLLSQNEYEKFLKTVGSLSNLFSQSNKPYLHYRIAEKLFCKAFEAEDLSRSDVSLDAKKGKIGIGLKTFLAENNKTLQKVTEFGTNDRTLYQELKEKKKIVKIAELRNQRIDFTQRIYDIEHSFYHCIVREENKFKIFEENLDLIDINSIKNIKENKGSITFDDGINEYSFLLSKNTLTKRFNTVKSLYEFQVDILKDPLELLFDCQNNTKIFANNKEFETIYLPLYGKNHLVFENSGLNQWNAKGRKRDYSEVYIPIPAKIHKLFPDFFPSRDSSFNLILPNKHIMEAKVCQDGGKALMSKSNKELGKWILRDVLKLNEGELLTYARLQVPGIDSIRIDKIDDNNYEINFAKSGTYDEFIRENSEG